ncbi:MAG: hypothetical protein UHC59_02355 [Fibrobacteraceae bacterium]|jgi:hypothetical protein|nr:hypothetical protein [Fibrobacteraceae bacterium]MEE1275811.1 hypothetical protein [Fibrobacteraceae bacterium]
MNSKLSGILFLLCIPLSIALFLFVSSATQSEILGLLSAVLLYMLAGVLISLFSAKKEVKNLKENKENSSVEK